MNGKYSCIALILIATLCLPGLAVAAPDTHRQEVEKLFRLTNMEKKINESVASIASLQLQQNPALGEHRDALLAFLEKHVSWNATREDLFRMYLQTFSEEELRVINAFYITPTGQKVITIVPQLVQQRNQLVMQRLQENIGELQAIVDNRKQ